MGDREDSSDEEEKTIADDVVVTKYKMAGDMANGVYITHIVVTFVYSYSYNVLLHFNFYLERT